MHPRDDRPSTVVSLADYKHHRRAIGRRGHGAAVETSGGTGGMPINEVFNGFEAWQRRRGLAESTIQRRRSHLAQWARWFDSPTRILDASWQDLEQFIGSLGELSAQTVYDRLSHLHQFYKWAMRHGHVDRDPTVMVDRPKTPTRLPHPIRDRDLARALTSAPAVTRAWIALGAYCGLRVAEIAVITAETWGGETLFVVGKGGRERFVPVHDYVVECVEALPLPEEGPLWLQPNGRPYTAGQVSRLLSEYLAEVGARKVNGEMATAHSLRHWCATRILEASGDVTVLQQMLGHSDPKTSMIYAQVQVDSVRRAAALLPRVA